jgi:hypothetical protein
MHGLARGLACVLSAAVFGAWLIFVGVRRMLEARRPGSTGRLESILWGLFGVVLGLAMIGAVVWIALSGPAPN